jgi:hypothetical protein
MIFKDYTGLDTIIYCINKIEVDEIINLAQEYNIHTFVQLDTIIIPKQSSARLQYLVRRDRILRVLNN